MIICCNTKYMYSKHVSTRYWHHINESTAMGSVSYNVIKLTDNSGNLNHLGKCVSSGLLILHGKKGKFRGIFRGKFAEKSADFAGFSREKSQNSRNNRPISGDFRGRKVKIRRKIGPFRGILAEKSQFSKDFQGQILRKIGRFHGKFRGETSPRNNQ